MAKMSNMNPAMFMLANYQIHIFGQNGAYALKFVEEAIEKDILCVAILEEKEHLLRIVKILRIIRQHWLQQHQRKFLLQL